MRNQTRTENYSVFSTVSSFSICTMTLITSLLFSCSTNSEMNKTDKPAIKLPVACKKMAPIKDIWKLEPILVKQEKIKEDMTKAEKEKVIRHYISNKSKQYEICLNTHQK